MKQIAIAAVLSLAALSGSAWAHGNEKHGKPPTQVKKEQKAWGIAGDANKVTRTVALKMTDKMRFTPDRVEVKLGETIRFVVQSLQHMVSIEDNYVWVWILE